MNLHEYQAKELLQQFGVAIPRGIKATSQQEAVEAAKEVRHDGPWVVKAQVHAGGRGKAGGVKFVRTIQDVEEGSFLDESVEVECWRNFEFAENSK